MILRDKRGRRKHTREEKEEKREGEGEGGESGKGGGVPLTTPFSSKCVHVDTSAFGKFFSSSDRAIGSA